MSIPYSNENISVSRFTLTDAVDIYHREWSDLVRRLEAPLELSPEWVGATGASIDAQDNIEVIIQNMGGHTTSVIPLLRCKFQAFGITCNEWQTPGDRLVANHTTLLTDRNQADCIATIIGNLPAETDLLKLPAVVRSSRTDEAIHDFCQHSGWRALSYVGDASPYLTISDSWDEFLNNKSRNFRYTLRRKEKGLNKNGVLSEQWLNSPNDVGDLLNAILLIEKDSWKVASGMAISQKDIEQKYYKLLLPFLAERGTLAANVLYLDSDPIAYSLGCMWAGKLAQLKTSFVEKYSNLSPGLVVNHHAIRYAFKEKCREFDFLGDVMPHKMHWTNEVRHHDHYYLFAPKLKARTIYCLKRAVQWARHWQTRKTTVGRSALKTR